MIRREDKSSFEKSHNFCYSRITTVFLVFIMLWSLLRSSTQRGLSWNTPCLFQRSRFSGLCKTSSVRFNVISSNFRHGSHGRLICTRCYRELDIAKGAISRHTRCLKFLSNLLPNVNRRFVGTRVSLNSTSASNMRNKTTAIYTIAIAVAVVGLSYLSVPLYRLYCQATGLGGTVKREDAGEKIEQMERKPERDLLIRFNADKSASMQWNFRPQQSSIRLVPGETALAFYTATNPTDEPITGISTYNVIPFEAGQYFNKIQCFCFEEQRLNPHEQVDMPVFFYIDPEFTEDPAMAKVDIITLSYTFFEAKEAEKLGL